MKHGNRGQAMIVAVVLFLIASMAVLAGVSSPVLLDTRITRELALSKQSYYLAEAGVEDVLYRLNSRKDISETETLSLASGSAVTEVVDTALGKEIRSVGDTSNLVRKVTAVLALGEGAAFNYGIQTDAGGLNLSNNAAVLGNVYSNGNTFAANGAVIDGDVVVSGSNLFFGEATGSVYAHTISNAQIGGDAHYQNISGSIVNGTLYPGSDDQPIVPLPDLSATIEEWKTAAEAAEVISCSGGTYTIESDVSIGPAKIECDMRVSNGKEVTLLGNIWVEGSVELSNNVTLQVDSSLGGSSVAIIADDPEDHDSGSMFELSNNIDIFGTGVGASSVMLVSMNESASQSINSPAINYSNNGGDNDVVFYAPLGLVNLSNNASISAITAYKANISNNTEVIYKSGLASLLFSSGPGGGYAIDAWNEVK